MSFPENEVAELKLLCSDVSTFEEAGCTYVLLPRLKLPDGCEPAQTDCLLCPAPRDGYESRLFFSDEVKCNSTPNWNATGVRIGERNWRACSWKVSGGLRLAQMVAVHLRALQ